MLQQLYSENYYKTVTLSKYNRKFSSSIFSKIQDLRKLREKEYPNYIHNLFYEIVCVCMHVHICTHSYIYSYLYKQLHIINIDMKTYFNDP